MAIKKAFQDLHTFLSENADKKVKTILEEAEGFMSAKRSGGGGGATAVHYNDAGEVVGILDYYFKKWMPVAFVEFGAKKSAASGLNTMCKEGVSHWGRQQREFKQAKEELLNLVAAGEVAPDQIQARLDELEKQRTTIEPYSIPEHAFDSVEDMLAADPKAMQQALDDYNQAVMEEEAEEADFENADIADESDF